MKITITKDEYAFDIAAAWRISTQMITKPDSVIGVSTGRTTGGMHSIVCDMYNNYPFDTSAVTIFNVDEITNIEKTHPASCYIQIKHQLIEPLNIPEQNFLMPSSLSKNFDEECIRFEQELEKRGGVDLQMLGIGANGHIGINQPGTPFGQKTWVTKMDAFTENRVRTEFNIGEEIELGGLTRGIVDIMNSRKIVLIAKGEEKAEILKKVIYGPITEDIPATILRFHTNCEFLLDEKAGALL